MPKVKVSSEHMSGKGTKVSIGDVALNHVTGFKITAGVGQPMRAEVAVLADGLDVEFQAAVDLTVQHRISDLSVARVRGELADLFERRLGHGEALFTIDEVIDALHRSADGGLKR
jgi:hypothetical protein